MRRLGGVGGDEVPKGGAVVAVVMAAGEVVGA